MDLRNFLGELKRRNVYRVGAAYVVVSWLLIQVATQVFPFFEIPDWAVRLVVMLLALGLPVALVMVEPRDRPGAFDPDGPCINSRSLECLDP